MPVNEKLTQEQWLRFQYCRDRGHLQFIEKAEKCDNYFVGDQWTKTDLGILQLQRRPALTINKILSTISTVLGEQIFNRAEVDYRPKSGAPATTADALNKVYRQIAHNNQLNWVRSDVFCDGVIRGRGFYDVRMDFNDAMQGEVRISLQNSKNVIIDPDAEEYDPDSWNDVFTTKWLTPQDISILYDEKDGEYLSTKESSAWPYGYDSIERTRDRFGGNQTLAGYYGVQEPHNVRRNVRVLERQYRRLAKQRHFVDPLTGDMRAIPDNWDRNKIAAIREKFGLEVLNKLTKRIRWTVTADNVLLHDDWSPYKHFTIVPYFPYFRYGRTVGIVENLLGPQELLNKVSSQELHVINTTANSGWIVKAGALVNMSIEELEQSGAQTGLVIEVNQDVNQAVSKITPNQIPTGLERVSYKAEEHIKTISNVTDNMQGNDREDVAAKAIAYKKQNGSMNFSKVMDNLERTDFILARNVLDLIQGFYTEERLIDIVHDNPNTPNDTVTVNQMTPEGEIINDLTLGEYSIVITSAPFRATLEDSQFEQAMAMREAGVPIPDDILINNSHLVGKMELVKRMEDAQKTPEAVKQRELQMSQLEGEVGKLHAEVADKNAETALKSAKAKKELNEASKDPAIEAAQEAALKEREMETELAAEREKMSMLREKHQMEIEFAREKHQQEMAIREEDARIDRENRQMEAAARAAAAAAKPAAQPTGETA